MQNQAQYPHGKCKTFEIFFCYSMEQFYNWIIYLCRIFLIRKFLKHHNRCIYFLLQAWITAPILSGIDWSCNRLLGYWIPLIYQHLFPCNYSCVWTPWHPLNTNNVEVLPSRRLKVVNNMEFSINPFSRTRNHLTPPPYPACVIK